MEIIKAHNPMTAEMVRRGLFQSAPFTMVDIGCSGGIDPAWRVFAGDLRAVAVDPMIAECKRLQRAESLPHVVYHPSFVGLPAEHPFIVKRGNLPLWGHNPWNRLSLTWAFSLLAESLPPDEHKEKTNAWDRQLLADPDKKLTVKQLIDHHGFDTVDFIKIDVDGHDLDVLISAEEVLAPLGVLGVALEVNFFGSERDTDNTFHNMDRLMRRHGYTLFGLTTRPYSHRALPAPFQKPGPAWTTFGPPLQGDALYLRDLADPEAPAAGSWPDTKLLKLAALFEIANVPDCAAELFTHFGERLGKITEVEPLLDLLVPAAFSYRRLRYREYVEMFRKDVTKFYPRQLLRPRFLKRAWRAVKRLLAG